MVSQRGYKVKESVKNQLYVETAKWQILNIAVSGSFKLNIWLDYSGGLSHKAECGPAAVHWWINTPL